MGFPLSRSLLPWVHRQHSVAQQYTLQMLEIRPGNDKQLRFLTVQTELASRRIGVLNDVLSFSVPLDGASLAQRSDSHLAGDGGTEAQVEGAVGFFAAANTIKEITHVGVGVRFIRADDIGLAPNL